MDRDKELDDLRKELRQAGAAPHVERPDELEMGQNGICWRDRNRGCTAACVAFGDADEPDPAMRCTLIKQRETTNRLLKVLVDHQTVEITGGPIAPISYEPPNPLGRKT